MDKPNQSTIRQEIESRRGGRSYASREGKSYECNYCKRGFSNAQALGGHMNIHRKDKAILRQGKSQHETSEDVSQRKVAATLEDASCGFPGQYYSSTDSVSAPWKILESSTTWESSQTEIYRLQDATNLNLHHHPDIVDKGLSSSSYVMPDLNLELRLGPGPEYGEKRTRKSGSKKI